MKNLYLFIFCLALITRVGFAQQKDLKLISANFQKATIDQFVADLESKTDYHFFYDQVQFDSLKITLQATDKSVTSILDLAFSNTDYHYSVVNQQIFLTRGRNIKTELASGFLQLNNQPAKQTSEIADYTDDRDKKVPEATTENKVYEIGLKTNVIKPGK